MGADFDNEISIEYEVLLVLLCRYQIEDGYDIAAVSGATDYTVLQAWDMTHGKRDEPPNRALQHSALYMDPGAAARDRPYDNIVCNRLSYFNPSIGFTYFSLIALRP